MIYSSGKHKKGFTLIEVMVAVAILALAGGAILKAVYQQLNSITSLEQITYATWVANNQITRASLNAQIKWPLKKTSRGETDMAGQKWYWKQDVSKASDQELYQVTVSVSTEQELTNPITTVTTFMAEVKNAKSP